MRNSPFRNIDLDESEYTDIEEEDLIEEAKLEEEKR